MLAPLLILGAVIVLTAVRQVGSLRLQIWQIFAGGAVVMLLTRSIGVRSALDTIEGDVMLFLFGVFVLGEALDRSGALASMSARLFSRARSASGLILLVLIGAGLASAVLMNDTIAIIGVPVVMHLARAHRIEPRVALLALAFAATAGSVMSPIGNPQNLLISIDLDATGVAPFPEFGRALIVPALGALTLSYVALRVAYPREFHALALVHVREPVRDLRLARLAQVALGLLLALVVVRVLVVGAGVDLEVPLAWIGLAPALFLLLASGRRVEIARGIDWETLVFFAALFVVMGAVDRAGVTEEIVTRLGSRVVEVPWILGASGAGSQLVSNVPLVTLYLPVLAEAGASTDARMALAAGSTLAGNLTLIGAASNLIIADVAERRFGERLSFWEFTRVGLPLGFVQLVLTWGWLSLIA